MTPRATRLASAAALGLALCMAVVFSDKARQASKTRIAEAKELGTVAAEAMAERERARELSRRDSELFMRGVQADAKRYDVESPSYDVLRMPNRHVVHLEDAITLRSKQTYENEHLRITAAVEKVRYQQHGAIVSARHAIAKVQNIGQRPVAYFLRLRSAARGHCEVRGARMHNAMALMPGEQADITVCAGGGAIRLERLEVMEVTSLGHRYLSLVPPSAVGNDPGYDSAHRPLERVEPCATLDPRSLNSLVREGLTRWSDIVDFFSRHSCERFNFPPGYRRADATLAVLPLVPSEAAPLRL